FIYLLGICPPPPASLTNKIRPSIAQTVHLVEGEKSYLEITLPNNGNLEIISKVARIATKQLIDCGLDAKLHPIILDLKPGVPLF
ncbi:MAG: hypothetical protein WCP03_03620, partial [Candidatus Saccharibacteria bacterium]